MLFTDEQVSLTRIYADKTFKDHGHVRKYTGEDYITHCDEIIDILGQYGLDTNHMKIVAYLHDIVEDTPTDHFDIWINYGQLIATDVYWLTNTNDKRLSRQERHAKDMERFAKNVPYWIHNLKLADMISNARSIREHDPKFAIVFAREARQLMEILVEHGHPGLYCDLDDELDLIFEHYHEQHQLDIERKLDVFTIEPEETFRKTLLKLAVNVDVQMMELHRSRRLSLAGFNGNIFVRHYEPSFDLEECGAFVLNIVKAGIRAYQQFYPDSGHNEHTMYDMRVYTENPLLVNQTGEQVVFCYRKSHLHPYQYIHLPLMTKPTWVTPKTDVGVTPHWRFALLEEKAIDQLMLGINDLVNVTPTVIPEHIKEKFDANANTSGSIYRWEPPTQRQ